ncbi:MAG: hypothetical protein HY831_03015 [Candidatus Aenigmarchaeota archaeon]|nr:hypothetical protein [Candidatus Aenigmarchaeota archaeon]
MIFENGRVYGSSSLAEHVASSAERDLGLRATGVNDTVFQLYNGFLRQMATVVYADGMVKVSLYPKNDISSDRDHMKAEGLKMYIKGLAIQDGFELEMIEKESPYVGIENGRSLNFR